MIGYHGVIRRDGTFEQGRAWNQPGAHVRGRNFDSVGICLVGGLDYADYTDAQFRSLRVILESWRGIYPNATICGHRDLDKRKPLCPRFDVAEWFWNPNG